jgi:[acyl-carrier-protein] S-malonyltransferase
MPAPQLAVVTPWRRRGRRRRSIQLPLVANVTARAVADAGTIRTLLVQQVTGLVRWRESVLFMKAQGVEKLVEIGAGKVLAGLAKRIDREIAAASVGEPGEIEALLKAL